MSSCLHVYCACVYRTLLSLLRTYLHTRPPSRYLRQESDSLWLSTEATPQLKAPPPAFFAMPTSHVVHHQSFHIRSLRWRSFWLIMYNSCQTWPLYVFILTAVSSAPNIIASITCGRVLDVDFKTFSLSNSLRTCLSEGGNCHCPLLRLERKADLILLHTLAVLSPTWGNVAIFRRKPLFVAIFRRKPLFLLTLANPKP